MKNPFRSKTHIFNTLIGAFAVLEETSGMLQSVLPANAYAVLLVVNIVGNAVIRQVGTKEALAPIIRKRK